ncbi:UNVERIFIED_CONTAM: hypothetical protein RMT77_016021 [Armadillidium vulgare]
MASQNVYLELDDIEVSETHLDADGGNVIIMTENSSKRQTDDEDYVPYTKRGRGERYYSWTKHLTLKLIELVKLHYSRLTDKRYKKQAWIDIWDALKPFSTEYELTLRQVEKKWRNLHHSYNRTIEQQRKFGKNKVRQREYFEEIDEICGSKPSDQNLLVSEHCILPISTKESKQQTPDRSFQMENGLHGSPIVTEISEAVVETTEKVGGPSTFPTTIESVVKELIEENRKTLSNEQKKIEVMEKDTEERKDFNKGILAAINKRTEIIDRQQASSLKIENILLMTQRYDDKLDRLENKMIKLENGMGRLETKIENYLQKLDKFL